jgi:hypothetical protein
MEPPSCGRRRFRSAIAMRIHPVLSRNSARAGARPKPTPGPAAPTFVRNSWAMEQHAPAPSGRSSLSHQTPWRRPAIGPG